MSGQGAGRLGALASGAALLIALVTLGFLAGGLVATRLFPSGGMGWDQLANSLGGMFLGIIAGLVVAVFLLFRLSARGRLIGIILAILGIAVCVILLNTVPAPKPQPSQSTAPPPLVEPFSLNLGTSDPLEGPRAPSDTLPWQFLRISSNQSFDYRMVDSDEHCLAIAAMASEAGLQTLRALRVTLEALPETLDCAPCPTCVSVGLEWYLDQERHTLSATDQCWRSDARLQPLRTAVESIALNYQGEITCE